MSSLKADSRFNSPDTSLENHVSEVMKGNRRFENVYQSVKRMIFDGTMPDGSPKVESVNINGKPTFDFKMFRTGRKHPVGMYDVIHSMSGFIKDAAEGGESKEMAFVLIGEPGNGKTFLVEHLCNLYREFVLDRQHPENRRYTFEFDVSGLEGFGPIRNVMSQTLEDPMILAMNLFDSNRETEQWLRGKGFDDNKLDEMFSNYRPLGACSGYIQRALMEATGGDVDAFLKLIKVIPAPVSDAEGTLTGKYSARDKITSSSSDLLGKVSTQRMLYIADSRNPYRFDLQCGALARVSGGGIHFSDELFKNKRDLIQTYLQVIQNRSIELDGFKWFMDTLVIATSNNAEFNMMKAEDNEAPIIDRCQPCFVGHNTDYKLQQDLTSYALGGSKKTTFLGNEMHHDPNLNYAVSLAMTLTRLPPNDKLTLLETMKLAAGEETGNEKGMKTLTEVIDTLARDSDVTKRWGQKGLSHRKLITALKNLSGSSESNQGGCMYAGDIFKVIEGIVYDSVGDNNEKTRYLDAVKVAKGEFRKRIETVMFNAYLDEPDAIKAQVMSYVNMIVGMSDDSRGDDTRFTLRDPFTHQKKIIRIDESFVKAVESRMGIDNHTKAEQYRSTILKTYGQKMTTDPNYDFMDNTKLVEAVTNVVLKTDINGTGALVGVLANRTNEENAKIYNRLLNTMTRPRHPTDPSVKPGLGYCKSCAEKTIEYYCTKDDQE